MSIDVLKPYIKTAQLAARLGLKRNTIEHWRRRGIGPQFVRGAGGRIYYEEETVREWLASCTHRSTAEYQPHQMPPKARERAAAALTA